MQRIIYRKTTFLTLFSIVIMMTSCDCYQMVRGTVIDKTSGLPLTDATVTNKINLYNKQTTDSLGNFQLSGGIFNRCPPMTVIVEKENYKIQEVKIPAGGEKTIKLEPIMDISNKQGTK